MKKISSFAFGVMIILFIASPALRAQNVTQTTFPLGAPTVVNFAELAQKELLNPPPFTGLINKEADEKRERGIPKSHPVPPDAKVTNITLPPGSTRTQSPTPVITFNGLNTNGTVIPPDVTCTAGLNHVMLTTNSQYRIQLKNGTVTNTLTINGFWASTGGQNNSYFDPRVTYDPYNSRWIMMTTGNVSGGHSGVFVAVSQTSDPTGLWFQYGFDAQSTSNNWVDFPTLGFNKDWVIVTGNMFSLSSGIFQNVKILVFNKSTLYSGSIGTVTSVTDASGVFSLQPAITYDNALGTEYLVATWNGNSGGNGYVRLSSITGSVGSPVYATGSTVGVNQPWAAPKPAPQSGNSNKIDLGDDRTQTSPVYQNGFLYCAQNVGLPSFNTNHTGCQWWKINPANATVSQFGRIEDPTAVIYYGYPYVTANNIDDVIVSYSVFSSTTFASAGYSYRTAADPVNTTESPFVYKNGLASYFISDGSRNRWGDYNGAAVDPVDNSFWTLAEYANSPANNWSDYWANVAASNSSICGIPGGLGSSNVTSNSATLTWSSAANAASYNIQYRQVGTGTWTPTSSSTTTVNISGLTPNTQYEFQVQSNCGGGVTSAFSASANFTTTAQTCNDVYEPNDSKGKAKAIPVNTDVFAAIGTSGDIDWLSFPNSSSTPNIKITMTNLTQDYDIQLYSTTGAKLKTSKNCCTLDEQIIYNTSVTGTYKIKVYGFNAQAFDPFNCYTLHVFLSSTPFKLEESASVTADSRAIRIFPNPNNGNMTVEYLGTSQSDVQLKVYDLMGKIVYVQNYQAIDGTNTYSINANQLSSGVYLVEINASGQVDRSKFIIEK